MKAIDTNILIRLIVKDDAKQTAQVLKMLNQEKTVYVSQLVMLEVIWVLESFYQLEKNELILAIKTILQIDGFDIEESESVWKGVFFYENSTADFEDCLLGAYAKSKGCESTITFDKKASKLEVYELLR